MGTAWVSSRNEVLQNAEIEKEINVAQVHVKFHMNKEYLITATEIWLYFMYMYFASLFAVSSFETEGLPVFLQQQFVPCQCVP